MKLRAMNHLRLKIALVRKVNGIGSICNVVVGLLVNVIFVHSVRILFLKTLGYMI